MANKYAQAAANWSDLAAANTWFDAAAAGSAVDGPTAGDTVYLNGQTVTIDTNIDLADYTYGDAGTLNIGAGVTVASVPVAWTIASNGGTITANAGTVTTNAAAGVVTTNNLTVTTNNGIVTTNAAAGTVTTNNLTVTTNDGTVTTNSTTGTVTTNNLNITTNNGLVTTNSATGVITLWNVRTAVTGCANAGEITAMELTTVAASVVWVATDLAPLLISADVLTLFEAALDARGITTVNQAQTGDSFARLGAPVGASISADIASVKANTATGGGEAFDG